MADKPAPEEEEEEPAETKAPPDPPELARLKIEKAIAETEAEIAEQRKKRISAMMPEKIEAPEGSKTTIDGDHPIESQILAYHALNGLARTIAAKVRDCDPRPTAVAIYSEGAINALLTLQAFKAQLSLIETRLPAEISNARRTIAALRDAMRAEAADAAAALTGAVLVASGVLRAAADLASLFRVNTTVKYKDFTIADLALVTAVAGALAEPTDPPRPIPVYHPELLPPGL